MADAAKQAVFDARWILPAPSGIGVYARELALRLPALLPEWRFALLVRPDVDPAALLPPGAEGRAEAVAVPFGPLSPKNQLLLPGLLRRLGADLYHAPSFMLPFRAFRRGGGARVRCLATIHDVIPLVVPDYAPASRTARLRPLFRWCLREAARRADVLLTVSETSRLKLSLSSSPGIKIFEHWSPATLKVLDGAVQSIVCSAISGQAFRNETWV